MFVVDSCSWGQCLRQRDNSVGQTGEQGAGAIILTPRSLLPSNGFIRSAEIDKSGAAPPIGFIFENGGQGHVAHAAVLVLAQADGKGIIVVGHRIGVEIGQGLIQ
jgi:hypothetical protein